MLEVEAQVSEYGDYLDSLGGDFALSVLEVDRRPARSSRAIVLLAASATVLLVIAVTVWLRAEPSSNAPRIHASDPASVPLTPVARDGWDPAVPRSVSAPPDPKLDDILGMRYPVSGPNGNWAGYGDSKVLQAVPNYAATPGNPEAASDAYLHEFVPLTKTADPHSEIVGYLLRGYGFVDVHAVEAPGFNVGDLIAKVDAHSQPTTSRSTP